MRMNRWPAGIVAFLALIVCLNVTLLSVAASGYGGLLDQHPYLKGLEYDVRKTQLESLENAGWRVTFRASPASIVVTDRNGAPLTSAKVTIRALRPNAPQDDRELHLKEDARGYYRTEEILSPGRWLLDIMIDYEGRLYRLDASITTDSQNEITL